MAEPTLFFFFFEPTLIVTAPLLLFLEHLSRSQEAEFSLIHGCLSLILLLPEPGSRSTSDSTAEIQLPKHKPTSPTAVTAAMAKDFSKKKKDFFFKLAPSFHVPSSLPPVSPLGRAHWEASWLGVWEMWFAGFQPLYREGQGGGNGTQRL